jgi:flagellar basal-body rod protein FlgC
MSQYSSIEVSASGLSAERLAMDVIANNLANANTTRTPEGGAFKRQLIVFAQKGEAPQGDSFVPDPIPDDNDAGALTNLNGSRAGVQAVAIVPDSTPDRLVYDPTHPDADAQGYVHMPNIDVVKEMVDMIAASRAYQANVTAIQEARAMGSATLGLLKA